MTLEGLRPWEAERKVAVRCARPRGALLDRLEERRPAIEKAIRARIHAIEDPSEARDPAYLEGLRSAMGAAIDYGFESIERADDHTLLIPIALLTQARVAARSGVPLDTVLRRYFAGYALLTDFLLDAAAEAGMAGPTLRNITRCQAARFDILVVEVSEEYRREGREESRPGERRRLRRVRQLLAGEILEAPELAYDLASWHVGLIASGAQAAETLRRLAKRLRLRLLIVQPDDMTAWVWLGGRTTIDQEAIRRALADDPQAYLAIALGVPGKGLEGWRLTHRQAAAALPVAQRSNAQVARYADVALLAATLREEVLADSLRQLYLEPLEKGRDDGATVRKTLRAYFGADRNVSSTAAALAVNRRTINRRLRTAEDAIGCRLDEAAAEIEAALQLDDLERQ
jgi:hypothetical protein